MNTNVAIENFEDYIGEAFTRRDGPSDIRAIHIVGFTKTGYIRYRELNIRREAARRPTLLGDTLEIEPTYKDNAVQTSRYKLVWNVILSRVVVHEKKTLWLDNVDDVGIRHRVHSVGVRPGARTPWTQ